MNRSYLFLFLVLFLVGCSSVSTSEAEVSALDFAKEHVRFYSGGDQSKILDPAGYEITIVETNEQDGRYTVVLQVHAEVDGEQKNTEVTCAVSKKTGKVILFNGQPVPQ